MYATPKKLAFQIEGYGLDFFKSGIFCQLALSLSPVTVGINSLLRRGYLHLLLHFLHLLLYSLYLLVSISYIKSIQVNTDHTVINVKNIVINVTE